MERKGTKGGVHSGRYTIMYYIFAGVAAEFSACSCGCVLLVSMMPMCLACSITDANKYTQDELRFMKSQDANYLALKAQTEMKVQANHAILIGPT